MRTIVDLTKDQLQALAESCVREKISRSEAVRQAVDAYLQKKRVECDDGAFGLWAGRGIDGLRYENTLRSEWES